MLMGSAMLFGRSCFERWGGGRGGWMGRDGKRVCITGALVVWFRIEPEAVTRDRLDPPGNL